MTTRLIILGCGGNASDILDVVHASNRARPEAPAWQVVGLLDDASAPGTKVLGVEVLGPLKRARELADRDGGVMFINAIGSDRNFRRRGDIIASTGVPADRFATVVHPSASVSHRARIGRGVCVNAVVSVGGNAAIGDHVWLGAGCIVGHDTTVGACSIVAPGAVLSGFVEVGPSCYVGSRAAVKHRIRLGEGALVGLGAAVVRDVEPMSTVVGVPARPVSAASRV